MEPTNETIEMGLLEAPVVEERPWAVFAACKASDPELFFNSDRKREARALAICSICPVRDDCLRHALDARERFGIWGGTTEKVRKGIFRTRV